MKGKLYRILIPLYFVLCMFLCGGIVFSADAFPILGDEKAQYLLSFGLVVVGLGIGKIIHAVFHEICHIIPPQSAPDFLQNALTLQSVL